MPEIRFHPEARDDYREALAWYRGRSPRAADRFEEEIERILGLVSGNPGMFPTYDDEHRFAMLHGFPYSLIHEMGPDLRRRGRTFATLGRLLEGPVLTR